MKNQMMHNGDLQHIYQVYYPPQVAGRDEYGCQQGPGQPGKKGRGWK